MKSKLLLFVAGLVGLMVVGTRTVDAQAPRLQIQKRAYHVEIVSQFGVPVRVGMFGYSNQATFRVTFDGGRTGPDVYQQELVAGDRVVCVWDRAGHLILVAALTIDSDGVLVLSPQVYGAAGAARAEQGEALQGGAMKGGMPQLKIRPKNP